MKILQVTAVDFTIRKFLLPLIDSLQRNGFVVDIACNCGEDGIGLKEKGYRIHHIPFARNLNIFSHLANVWRLVKLIKKEKYHCLHTHTPVASIIARLAGKIARVPVVIYTAHGFYFHENMLPAAYKIAYWIEKIWGKHFSDYLFFQSKEDYELALRDEFNHPERLLHIGNGVSAKLFDPSLYDRDKLRKDMGFSEQDVVIIFIGRLVNEKGIRELIEAYKSVKIKHPQIKLIVVGGSVAGDRDGIDIPAQMTDMSEEAKEDLSFLGLRNDIPELLSVADIFILPSYREGLPRSIIEAMAMKKPVIATNIRGCREEVLHGYNGYLCEARNSRDLTDKISMLLENSQKINEFGMNSRQLFLNEFDEEKVLEKELKVFCKIRLEVQDV